MLPTKTNEILNLNEGTDAIRMSIDAASSEFLMGVLTDLYKFKIPAVVREYSTNAQDATKAAGSNQPIEVTLPNERDLFFTVKDYGTGMSYEDIVETYSKYGASQSRNSNDVTGMLGLGSKSALTYTSSFTVDTVKNGKRIVATVSKTNTVPTIEILGQVNTDEPNGTTIKVPVDPYDITRFVNAANHIYSFWSDPILVNNKPPTPFWKETGWTQLDDDVWFSPIHNRSYIVQGNVSYEAFVVDPKNSVEKGAYVAFVPNGFIDFIPSREEMRDTDLSKDTIRTVERFVKDCVERATKDYAMKEPIEVLDMVHRFGTKNVRENILFPFSKIPVTYKTINLGQETSGKNWVNSNMLAYKPDGFYVQGFKPKKLAKNHAERLRFHINENNLTEQKNIQIFILPDLDLENFDFPNVILWENVKTLKRSQDSNGSSGGTSTAKTYDYEVYVLNKEGYVETQQISGTVSGKTVLYGHQNSFTSDKVRQLLQFNKKMVVVPLTANRINKFVRLHPQAICLSDWMVKAEKRFLSKLTEEKIDVIKAHYLHDSMHYVQRETLQIVCQLSECLTFNATVTKILEDMNKLRVFVPFFVNTHNLFVPYDKNVLESVMWDETVKLISRMQKSHISHTEIKEYIQWKKLD